MMFLLMVRIEDPLVPRAMFGILNTLLFFPSGSVYPIQAFPPCLRAIARCDPFTYSVDGFKCLLMKETTLSAVWGDMLFLGVFATVTQGDRELAVEAGECFVTPRAKRFDHDLGVALRAELVAERAQLDA